MTLASAISAALTAPAAEVAIALLGEPNRALSSRRELRFGRKGSLAVVIEGRKCGQWYDHEVGIGGDLIDLIQRVHGINFPDAITYAEQFFGLAPTSRRADASRFRGLGRRRLPNEPTLCRQTVERGETDRWHTSRRLSSMASRS